LPLRTARQLTEDLGALNCSPTTVQGHGEVQSTRGSLPTTTQQTLLVNMLHISRKFAVADCASACYSALMATRQRQLDTVHLVLSLLPIEAAAADTDSVDLRPLIKYALDHLQQQLGDLEATFNSSQLLLGLQRLPHSALLGLLQDDAALRPPQKHRYLQHHLYLIQLAIVMHFVIELAN